MISNMIRAKRTPTAAARWLCGRGESVSHCPHPTGVSIRPRSRQHLQRDARCPQGDPCCPQSDAPALTALPLMSLRRPQRAAVAGVPQAPARHVVIPSPPRSGSRPHTARGEGPQVPAGYGMSHRAAQLSCAGAPVGLGPQGDPRVPFSRGGQTPSTGAQKGNAAGRGWASSAVWRSQTRPRLVPGRSLWRAGLPGRIIPHRRGQSRSNPQGQGG